ncbi:phosphoesterase, partial [Streptomyces sp. OF3]|nr:phosphoesterase [Streptomyces alkaliterrae]
GRGGPGRWVPALGCSDAHREPQVVGHPQTVVRADDLTRRDVLAAVRAGRSYLAESSAVSLRFSAVDERGGHAGIGEVLRTGPDARVTVRIEASGAAADAVCRLLTDQGELRSGPAGRALTWRTTAAQSTYVRAEVRRPGSGGTPGAMVAMTNPLWLSARSSAG